MDSVTHGLVCAVFVVLYVTPFYESMSVLMSVLTRAFNVRA